MKTNSMKISLVYDEEWKPEYDVGGLGRWSALIDLTKTDCKLVKALSSGFSHFFHSRFSFLIWLQSIECVFGLLRQVSIRCRRRLFLRWLCFRLFNPIRGFCLWMVLIRNLCLGMSWSRDGDWLVEMKTKELRSFGWKESETAELVREDLRTKLLE